MENNQVDSKAVENVKKKPLSNTLKRLKNIYKIFDSKNKLTFNRIFTNCNVYCLEY